MAEKYDSDEILDVAKVLIRTAREQVTDPMVAKMALEAAASQIEREVVAQVHAQAYLNALTGGGKADA